MKRQQQSVLLAGVLALSLTACSSIGAGWKGLFGSSPMPPQAAAAPAPAHSAATTASPEVTASAAENGNASGSEPNAKN
ncbi:MAG: hypothetical protein M3R60_03450 [Pseudomonadota bacterium]|nr:hypothetical protein [Pseudomonadota bacterium]